MMEGDIMPGFEEMPPPEEPGRAMPAGAPMGPGGFPGDEMGMGMGMGGFETQPATPMKIKIHVKLEISEVGL